MYKEELQNNEYPKSVLQEPMQEYHSAQKRVREDLQVSIEQADNGVLIPMEDVFARYK